MHTFHLRRRLVAGLFLLLGIVAISGGCSVYAALTYRTHIHDLHRFERAARRAGSIGVVAREQYIHEAHTIIVGDRSHLAHHDAWVHRFDEEVASFRGDLGGEQLSHLEAVAAASRALARVFEDEIVPALAAHDAERVRDGHERAISMVDDMTTQADALEAYFEVRATEAAARADRAASAMLVLATAAFAIAAVLAAVIARRVWRDFAVPLVRLAAVAERVSTGDQSARVGELAAEELAAVGRAFDAMLDALAEQRTKLLATDRLAAIGRVAAGVAHEINNPIAVIRGYVKTMHQDAPTPEFASELRILDEEAAACQRIAEDLLAYARTPALAKGPTDIGALIQDVVARGFGSASANVRLNIEPAMLDVDPLRFKQVMTNLVRNAVQACPDAPVEIVGRQVAATYELTVQDRGPGVPPELREHLFEPFFTTRPSGVGLGLSVSYGLVTAHGGTIHAEPRVGGGLRVVIGLPTGAA